MSTELYILLLFLFLLFLAVFSLICLAFLTPWTKRVKSYFYTKRYPFTLYGISKTPFVGLFVEDLNTQKGFRRTEPEIYLSLIIPAFNEEFRLPKMLDECLEYLNKRAENSEEFTFELVYYNRKFYQKIETKTLFPDVALNYSKQQNQNNPIYVLKLNENIGKGGSVRAGVLCARGRFLLFSDADGATKFSDFLKLEKEMFSLCNGENEEKEQFNGESSIDWTHPALVVGSRAHLADEAIAKRSLLRTVLMLGFHAMVWVFTVRTVRDTQCGFKLFSRAAAAKLFSQQRIERWAFDVELIYLAERLNFSIAEVCVEWEEIDGSKLTPLVAGLQMGRDILLLWFRYTFGFWTISQN
uniref:dolichyl-phosphate beta-glucosyltransferase n=1 Tax=Meloidogyne incognita TaxID=6306 RepID=A0A914LPQ1_MELIC